MLQVVPDWSINGTVESIERYFGNGFKFSGTGFYLSNYQTILILPLPMNNRDVNGTSKSSKSIWRKDWDSEQIFQVNVYSVNISQTIFRVGGYPPAVVDNRSSR